jgi:hypothetical protein
LFSEYYAGFGEVIRRHFQFHFVAWHDAYEILPHFARDMREQYVTVCKLHPEHGSRQHVFYDGLSSYAVCFRHGTGQKVPPDFWKSIPE